MAMAEAQLPEEIVVDILCRLPVKSLIRFSCVSKRLHFIIFSDPKFARSQFEAACQQKTLSRRLLISTDAPQLASLDLETPSFGDDSSVRKLNIPLQRPGGSVRLLGSCNGLVIVCFGGEFLYIWNPTIGLFKQFPDPGFSSNEIHLSYYGFGYMSATDNYKVLLACYDLTERKDEVEIFSLSAQVWKRVSEPSNSPPLAFGQGTLMNEALHWGTKDEIVVFDLAQEEFRKMRLPNFHQHGIFYYIKLGVSFGGCLCVCRGHRVACDTFEFWVMREYDLLGGSWTQLFNVKLSNPPEELWLCRVVLVMESFLVVERSTENEVCWVRIDYKGEELGMYMTEAKCSNMIPYEESLLWINAPHFD